MDSKGWKRVISRWNRSSSWFGLPILVLNIVDLGIHCLMITLLLNPVPLLQLNVSPWFPLPIRLDSASIVGSPSCLLLWSTDFSLILSDLFVHSKIYCIQLQILTLWIEECYNMMLFTYLSCVTWVVAVGFIQVKHFLQLNCPNLAVFEFWCRIEFELLFVVLCRWL